MEGSRGRILVVDAAQPLREMALRALAPAGHEVVLAASGAECLAQAARFCPDLILLAVTLPDVDGYEACRRIRAVPEHCDCVVVHVALDPARDLDFERSAQAGADSHISGPVGDRELFVRVASFLRHKSVLDRLRQQAALLSNAQRIGRMGWWNMDLRAGSLSWSDSTRELFGLAPGEFRGTLDHFRELIVPEDRPLVDAAHERAQDQDGVIEAEYRIRAPDGGIRWLFERGNLVRDAAGRPLRRLGMVMDITARKVEELAKQSTALRNAALVQALGEIVYEWRPASGELFWNGSVTTVLGYTLEQMGRDTASWIRRIHPEDAGDALAEIERAVRERRKFSVEYRFLHADGTYRWMRDAGVSYMDVDGEPERVVSVFADVTARRGAEVEREALLQRERAARRAADEASRYYRALFESAPGCYLVLTPADLRIVAVSDAYLTATMTTRSAIAGRKLFEVFPDDPTDPRADGVRNLSASFERVKATGRSDVMAVQRYPIRRPESEGGGFEERYWSPVNHPLFGPDGQLEFIIHRIEDVTEYLCLKADAGEIEQARRTLESRSRQAEPDIVLRSQELKRAHDRLAESQALLRIATQVTRLGAWIVDLPDLALSWSEEVREILELPGDHAPRLGKLLDHYVPEHRQAIRAAFESCIESGTPYDLELQVVTATGRRIWTRSIGEAVRDPEGRIVRVQGAFQDISGQRAAADQLHLLRTAVSRLNDVVMITEAEPIEEPGPRIVFVNEAFERLTGYALSEVIGKSPRILQGEKTERDELDRIRAALKAWQPVRAELTNYAKDGRELRIELDIVPIADATGWYTHWVSVERDVTERRLLAERLGQSQRLESVGQLTGGVAHDFNNLLTVILGNSELLRELLDSDLDKQRLAEAIFRAAQRGAELTQQLLAFARQQPLDPRPLDVGELLANMRGLLCRTLGEHIDVRVVCGEGVPHALIDSGQLESAVLNLCINARDAMSDGGRLILETAWCGIDAESAPRHGDVAAGEYVLLTVSDSGVGIPPEHMSRIFEPFYTTKPRGKGTGLGLAMVYGFVKQSGGHISIYSEPGHGTTVRLYLPAAAERVAAVTEAPPSPLVGDSNRGSESILLVEDNELVRRYTAQQLMLLGYRVIEAENGPEALKVLRSEESIDLLFTDVVMPGGMNGRQLAEEAGRLRPGLPVLYTSGYTENTIVHQGRLDAGVRLLVKPFSRVALAQAVRESLPR